MDALSPRDQAKVLALFERLGNRGSISSPEKFKKIRKTDFFEFKCFQIRMPCFYSPGGVVIVTHGFVKKGNKIPKVELERADRIKTEDAARAQGNRLE